MTAKKPMFSLSSSHIYFLFYVLTTLQTSSNISSASYAGNETDYRALLKIKSMITQDPYGALVSWNNSLHFCDWTGVTCGKRHKRVTGIVLESQGLVGSLSPRVGNLSFLHKLDLLNNSFQGVIPYQLGLLTRLRFLYLYENNFSGVIPPNVSGCSNLEVLGLNDNNLVGSIPKEISYLSKLTYIGLGHNKLTGGIPSFLGNITSVQGFSVTTNPLGGSIPDSIGNWKNLDKIYLGVCNLTGIIPRSIYNLSLLTNISLAENELTGSLPLAIGEMFPNLVSLQVRNNQLSGPLPPSISNCSRLIYLEMSANRFSGKLTIDFGKLRDIYTIKLGENNFGSKEDDEMKFIDSLNCTRLNVLGLSYCNFQGVLPRSIGNLSNQLQYLHFQRNQLHGILPSSVGNLLGLIMLSLGGNRFSGNIPSTIGKLERLEKLLLYYNLLSGQIPHSIGNLTSLIALDFDSNNLEGVIPSSLGNCQRLLQLDLSNNKFIGEIPTQLLQLSSLSLILDLSQNNLFGSLPTEVGNLKVLSNLDVSYNNLSGDIPSSLSGCTSISRLCLKSNFFQGTIPPSLSSLKGLAELDISRNNLSGEIPQFLERFLLKYLNLSYNDFEGEVPMTGVFANASAFFALGNGRLCGGIVDLGLSRCKRRKKHAKKFPLFAIVLLIASTLLTIICLAYAWFKKKRKDQASQSSASKRFLKVSYNQLLKATNGFSEATLIGKGGFSSVYKGIIDNYYDGRFVSIKVLHLQNRGAQRSFTRECEAWRNIRHRNLLKIITSCLGVDFQGNDFKALVYEYMSRGSLHDWLHSNESTSGLNLRQRINILIDIASALDYIHNHCIPAIVHGDLKPSNVLLDDDMVAHVGDFGLARFIGTTLHQNASTENRGTIGYAAPEYGLGSEMTSSGDVYSFGILLLEVMTRKKPTYNIFNEGLNLHKFASMALPDHVTDVIDAEILNIYEEGEIATRNMEANANKLEECMVSTLKIGVSCSEDSPTQRMDIKSVLNELHRILDTLKKI